jgi:hypothetical protein
LLQGDREICRDRRFAHAAFTACHRDHVFDPRDSRCAHAGACACGRRMNIDQHLCALNTVDGSQRFLGLIFNCRWNIRIVRRQGDLYFDFASLDLDRFHKAE